MRKFCLLASLLFVTSFSIVAAAQPPKSLVGTWRLVSVKSTTLKGVVNATAFGKTPTGFATFTHDGRLAIIMSDAGRKPLSVVDRVSAPVMERAEAYATCVAYAGSYTVQGDTVVYHIQAATIQNWVHSDLTRHITWKGNRFMSLTTPITLKGGVHQTIETTWERVK